MLSIVAFHLGPKIAAFAALVAVAGVACGGPRPSDPTSATSPPAPPAEPPAIGARARPFTRPALSGGTVSIPTNKDATVFFFFATWSSPDLKLLSLMEETARAYPEAAIFAVSVDDEEKNVLDVARSRGATYPIVWDARHELAAAYRPENVPTVYVIDRESVIRFMHRGFHDGEHEEIESELASLVKSNVCGRPLVTSDGPACFRQCARIAKHEAACTTPDCRKECSPSACRERCAHDNERRNAALALCRQRPPRGREACEAACHSEQHNDAIRDCEHHSAGQRDLLAECESVCGVGPCRAACRR